MPIIMQVVYPQNPLAFPISRSDQNPTYLRSNPDQTLFPIRIPFNLSTSTLRASSEPTASLPEPAKEISPLFSLFQSYGFTDEQIQDITLRHPRVLFVRLNRTIKQKFDYLLSFGFSAKELVLLVLADPYFINFSLENRIIHNLNFLVDSLGSRELVRKSLMQCPRLIRWDLDNYVVPNLETLRANDMSTQQIIKTFTHSALILLQNPVKVVNSVKEIRMLGIQPSSGAFIKAIETKVKLTQCGWDSKVELFKSYGWSDDDFMVAFAKQPNLMMNSEAKIKKMMEFYVNKLGWDPLFISAQPVYIGLSLEKRVIPRCAVLEVLASRGLLGTEMELHRIFVLHTSLFEQRYVTNFEETIPAVLKAYQTRQEDEANFAALRSWQERMKQTAIRAANAPVLASSDRCTYAGPPRD